MERGINGESKGVKIKRESNRGRECSEAPILATGIEDWKATGNEWKRLESNGIEWNRMGSR